MKDIWQRWKQILNSYSQINKKIQEEINYLMIDKLIKPNYNKKIVKFDKLQNQKQLREQLI